MHASSDPQRIGVVARKSQWIRDDVSFNDFASFVDRTIADATKLFEELSPAVEMPSTNGRCCVTPAEAMTVYPPDGTSGPGSPNLARIAPQGSA